MTAQIYYDMADASKHHMIVCVLGFVKKNKQIYQYIPQHLFKNSLIVFKYSLLCPCNVRSELLSH